MNQTYRLVRGSIRLPRDPKSTRKFNTSSDYLVQGQVIPEGVLDQASIASLLSQGRIELLPMSEAQPQPGMTATRGKWGVDPVGLVGKSLEDLLIMVQDIDADYDVSSLKTEADAIRLLTADWNPAFREPVTKAVDRNRPERLRTDGNVRDAGIRPMSEQAERNLANAKERAAGAPEAS